MIQYTGHRRCLSYECRSSSEATPSRRQKLVDFVDSNAIISHHNEQQHHHEHQQQQHQQQQQHHTSMSMDDTFVSSVDSSPVDFRRVLWNEGEVTTPPSLSCNDESSHQSDADTHTTRRMEALHRKEIQRVRDEMATSMEEKVRLLLSSHAASLQELRTELESTYLVELERSLIEAKRLHLEEIECLRSEMEASSALASEGQLRESSSQLVALPHGTPVEHEVEGDSTSSMASDSVEQDARTPCEEQLYCVDNSHYESIEEDQEHQQQIDVTGDSFNEDSFYIGEEEGLAMFESIEESDISETDVSGDSSYESISVDESVAVPEEDAESTSKRRESQCENLQCVEHRSKLQLSMEECERMKNELEWLKSTHREQTMLLNEKHNDELDRLRAEMASSASSVLDVELNNITRLKDELATANSQINKLRVHHDAIQAEYSAEISSLARNKLEVEAQVQSLQMKMDEMVQYFLDETSNLKASFDEERTTIVSEQVSLVRSIKEDFENKLDDKNRKLEDLEQMHRECTTEHDAQTSQLSSQLSSAIAANNRLEQRVQVLTKDLDGMSTKLASTTSEKDGLVSNLATARTDKESMSLKLTLSEDEKGAIRQQLESVCTERNDLLVKVAHLKDSLDECVEGNAAIKASLDDATRDISCQREHIEIMEAERTSLLNQITELKEQVSSQNMRLKSIQDKFSSTVDQKDRELADVANELRNNSAEHCTQLSQLESRLTSVIEEAEKVAAQLDTARIELSDSSVQVARLKDSLDESVDERNTMQIILDNARREVEYQRDRIGVMETERLSHLSRIRELEQQMTDNDAHSKSIQDDFDSKVEEKDREIDKLTKELLTNATEYVTRVSHLEGQLKSAVNQNDQLDERNQILLKDLDDTNTKLTTITRGQDCFSSNLAAVRTENESLLLRASRIENENAAIVKQLGIACTERDDLVVQVAKLKDSLDEAVVEKAAIEETLEYSRRDITRQLNHIASMETEHLSQANKVQELEQQIANHIALLKSIEEDFKITVDTKDRELSEVVCQLHSNAEEHAKQISGLESQLRSSIGEHDCLANNVATAQADYTTLSSHVSRIEGEKVVLEQQLATVHEERESLSVHHTNLKGSLDEFSAENESLRISLNDTKHQIELRDDNIAALKTERSSLSNQITELEQKITSQSTLITDLSMETAEQSNKLTSLHDSIAHLQTTLSSKETRIMELSTSNNDLVNKYLLLVEKYEGEQSSSSMILSLEAQLSNIEVDKSKLFDEVNDLRRVLQAKDDDIASLTESLAVAETSSFDLKEQLVLLTLNETDWKTENQTSLEIDEVNEQLGSSERDSRADSRSQSRRRVNRVQDLDRTIATMNSDSQDLLDKIDHFQGLAAKLSVSVLKLKLQGNEHDEQMMKDKASFDDQFLALSEKGTELRWLYAKVMDKTGVLFDLRQENDQLMKENMRMLSEYQSKAAAIDSDRALIEQLQSENQRLHEISSDLRDEKEVTSKLRRQLRQAEDALSELRAAMLHVDSSLEEALHDKTCLSHEVDRLNGNIATLECEKKSWSGCLNNYQQQTAQLSHKVSLMVNEAKSNAIQILELDSQLVSKMNKVEASSKNSSIELDEKRAKADVKVAITSLRSNIDAFIHDFENIAAELDVAVKELNNLRGLSNPAHAVTALIEAEPTLTEGQIELLSQKESQGCISGTDLDRIRTFMAKAQEITANSERERKLLEKEVKRLRAELERSGEECVSVRDDALTMSRMRNAVSQSKTLLEKAEREKHQLELNLMNTRKEMERIQQSASQSYNAIIEQSKDEITKLKMENESIKSFMSSSMAPSTSSNNNMHSVVSQVSSVERFKVEKGQSMFDMLKGTKKSGRKDNVKYRRTDE